MSTTLSQRLENTIAISIVLVLPRRSNVPITSAFARSGGLYAIMKNRIRMLGPDGSRYFMTDPWVGLLHSRIQSIIEDCVTDDDSITEITPIDSILGDTEYFEEVATLIRFGVWDDIKDWNDGQKN